MIRIHSNSPNNQVHHVSKWRFPDGCRGVNVYSMSGHANHENVVIVARLSTSDDIMSLLMTVDAIRRMYPSIPLSLYSPYIPYGRQDRVCNDGDSLSIAVMANLINSCGFSKVTTLDVHSPVTLALINNIINTDQHQIKIPDYSEYDVVVAPDQGAIHRARSYAARCGINEVCSASKVRNLRTGEIISYELSGDVAGKKVLVVDDILDGGRTFEELSTQLKKAGCDNASLFVTHGMFTKGFDVCKLFETVYTTNSYRDFDDVYVKNLKVIDVYK